MASYKIYLRKNVAANGGKHPVYLRLTIARVTKIYSLRVYVRESDFANIRNDKRLSNESALISKAENKAGEILARYRLLGIALTFSSFEKEFAEDKASGVNFIEFIEQEIKLRSSQWDAGTIRMKKAQLSKLKEFAPGVCCHEIDFNFCQRYITFLRFTRLNNSNTISRAISNLRTFINWAILKELMRVNEALKAKCSPGYALRVALSVAELMNMYNGYKEGKAKEHMHEVCRAFLFACFTGLRFTDLRNVTSKNLEGEMLVLLQQKTGRPVRIPLHEKALELVGQKPALGRLFKVPVNQVYNRQLKDLAGLFEIKKHISSHTARHTFACVGLELGISLKSISDMLGHNSIRTTEIYARMNDTIRKAEAQKFNSL